MDKIIKDLNWRYATKIFDSQKKLETSTLESLKESLRLSASSFGLQLWKFVNVENEDVRQKLLEHSWGQKQVVDSSHLIVLAAPRTIEDHHVNDFIELTAKTRNVDVSELDDYKNFMRGFIEKMTIPERNSWMSQQVYLALGNLLTVAATLEVDTCPIEGFVPTEYDKILGLEEKNLRSVVVCSLGYRSEEDKYSNLKKVRYPLEQVLYTV
jgi:nitroreductase